MRTADQTDQGQLGLKNRLAMVKSSRYPDQIHQRKKDNVMRQPLNFVRVPRYCWQDTVTSETSIIFVRSGMNRWRENPHQYRRLLHGNVSQQTRGMLEELAQEAEAIAAEIETAANSDAEITKSQAA
jgi:hypothetical protein